MAIWGRFEGSPSDSLQHEVEGEEAHPPVCSVWRGSGRSDGAMGGRRWRDGVSPSLDFGLQVKKEKGGREKREEGGWWLQRCCGPEEIKRGRGR
jgi:hypothetical protein